MANPTTYLNITLPVPGAASSKGVWGTTVNDAFQSLDTAIVAKTGGTFTGAVTLPSPVINTGVSGSAVLDSDTMSGANATTLATSESIKAYVDAHPGDITGVTAGDGLTGGGTTGALTMTVVGGTGITANADDIALTNTAVTAGSYGSASQIPAITVDAQGRITSASQAAISSSFNLNADSGTTDSFAVGGTLNLLGGTGLTSTVSDDTVTFAVDNTAVTAGAYGSSSAIPAITIDAQGRITAASTNAISSSFSLNADAGTTDVFAVGDTLNLLGGTALTSTVTNDTVTFGLDDDSIDSVHYKDGSIDSIHIADDQIDSQHYAAGSIDNEHLADDAVSTGELANDVAISTSGTIVTTASAGFTSKGIDDNCTIGTTLTVTDDKLLISGNIEANTAEFVNTNFIGNVTGGGSGGDLTWARSGVTKFFVDTSAGRVGILQASPGYTLDVGGTFRATGTATFDSTVNGLEINTTATSNIGLGATAVDSITTGDYNVGVGDNALTANTTGSNNVGIGRNALAYNTDGSSNTGVGSAALWVVNGGNGNTGIGEASAGQTTSGFHNTAAGFTSLAQNTTGQKNTAIGGYALQNSTGNYNTALGYQAGDNITSGSSNIIIGNGIDADSATASNQLNIGGAIKGDLSTNVVTLPGSLTVSGSIASGDLILNNTDKTANEVDGTKGHWVIQEGSNDLFIMNKITNKKYKFNLKEV